MNILLIRHSEPDYSIDSLTRIGFEQARDLAHYLGGMPVTDIFCSPFGRAQATMRPTSEALGIKATTLQWLREMDRAGDNWQYPWNLTPGMWLDETKVTPINEVLAARMRETVDGWNALMTSLGFTPADGLYRQNSDWKPDRLVLVFCHGGIMLTLFSRLFEWPIRTSYTMLGYMPSGITHLQMTQEQNRPTWSLCLLSYGSRPHLSAPQAFPLHPARY